MDMELQRITLEGYRPVFDGTLMQEETLESLVPDAYPDISRIVSAVGQVFLKHGGTDEGVLRLNGNAQVTVLYIPENERAPRSLDISIPFQCGKDSPSFRKGDPVQVSACITSAEARMINPRKVLVRVGLSLSTTVYSKEETELGCDISGCEGGCLEKRFSQHTVLTVPEVVEKSFAFSEILRQPSSKPVIDEVLCCRGMINMVDAKFIGKKLVLKGDIQVTVLYRSGDATASSRFELPYSQVIDMGVVLEEADPELDVNLKSLQCQLQDGEIEVSAELCAQIALQTRQSISVLNDVYCTVCSVEAVRNSARICTGAERISSREIARQFCESGIPARQVLDCCAAICSIDTEQDGDREKLTAQANVDILYLSEDDALCGVSFMVPVACSAEVGCRKTSRCRCRPVGEATAVPVTGGLEVRFEVEFTWNAVQEDEIVSVGAANHSAANTVCTNRPSVIIRRVCQGEMLWDIAKSCGSTVRDICGANGLQSEEAACGDLLLIPTKRS